MNLKKYMAMLALCVGSITLLQAQSKLVTTIPFEIIRGSIVLKVKINDNSKTLRLLFDTGADGMAVAKTTADSIGLKVTRNNNASVVGGSMKIDVSDGNDIHMENGFVLKNQGIAIFPKLDKGLDGLIGNTMTKRYVTKVDFNKYELSLYEFENYQPEKGSTVIPITIPDGLFIIPGNVEIVAGKTHVGNFVFDTGASYNLICFRPFVKKNKLLISGFKSDYHASTVSMGVSSPTFNGKASSFSFANTQPLKNMPITLMAGGGQNEDWNPGFDGSIGMGIISRYNFTINRQKNEIYFMPNHSLNYPLGFNLSPYLMAFNLKGELEITGHVRVIFDNEVSLPTGTKINSINGITAKAMLADASKIEQLKALPRNTELKISYVDNNKQLTATYPKQ
ncbi:MAG: retropepsin-like aspartic protease [Pedobacter sp.]|uniref:retropepsin-like aspartic protease n=1 Tax=Pedobacter sp. TaxID=1411316 RepID=UPI002806BBD3|nr:retropepsin-like aspartic protease [Pedobacter sp.]MDQ8005178.1 retropepsin-like aspartic protease [Pedobacter sp.]